MKTKDAVRLTLIDLMEERNVSGKDLAEAVGVSKQAVSSWRTGKSSIDIDNVPAICDFLDVTIDDFFGRSRKMQPTSSLSPKERDVVELFRSCDEQQQEAVLSVLRGFVGEER